MTDVPSRWSGQQAAVLARQVELEIHDGDPAMPAVRARYEAEAAWWNEGGPDVPTEERRIPTRHGDVRVLVHRPAAGSTPVIVWIHGGGFIVGSPETHHRLTRTLAHLTAATVVSVDYTLAPEARYPQPIEECADVVAHLREHGSAWGIVGDDVTFAGDSAGAAVALATWLWLRDEGADDGVRCLLLAYGGYGLRDSTSRRALGGPWDGMTREAMAEWEAHYIDPADVGARYHDLLSADLTGAPPCHILATTLDPLLDDSRALFAHLGGSGAGHELVEVDGVLHTFLQYTRMLDQATASLEAMAAFFLRQTV